MLLMLLRGSLVRFSTLGQPLQVFRLHEVRVDIYFGVYGGAVARGGMLVIDESKLDGLSQPLALLGDDGELATFGLLLDPQTRVPHNVDVTRDPRHHKVVEMVVKWSGASLESWVSLDLSLVSIALGQVNDRAGEANILNQLVRCLAEAQDVAWQEDAHHLLEVSGQLLFERLQANVLPHLSAPLFIEIGDNVLETHLLDEVDQFKFADLLIVSDALVLPAAPTEELVRVRQEQDEPHGQERDREPEHNEDEEKHSSHLIVLPKHQVSHLLEEISDDVHPLKREIGTLLAFLVLAPHAKLRDVVLGFGLRNDLLSLLALKERVDRLDVHDLVHCHHIIGRHQVFVEEVLSEEEIVDDRRNVLLPELRVGCHNPNANQHDVAHDVVTVEEVDEELAEDPACVGEARVVEVEDEHVCIDDVFEEGDHELGSSQHCRHLLERVVVVEGAILHNVPIRVVHYA